MAKDGIRIEEMKNQGPTYLSEYNIYLHQNGEHQYCILGSMVRPKEGFVGREKELETLEQELQENRTVFLWGIGGIGKSELAKQYASQWEGIVVWASYTSSLRDVVMGVDLDGFSIPAAAKKEELEQYYCQKKTILKQLCAQQKVLLIVDNFNEIESGELEKLEAMGWYLLFTTRNDWGRYGKCQIQVLPLEPGQAREIFFHSYGQQDFTGEELSQLDQLIQLVDCHTITVELLAKQMREEEIPLGNMLAELREKLKDHQGTEIPLSKDGKHTQKTMYQHLRVIFDISREKLSEDQIQLLKNLLLVPYTGMEGKQFLEWCGMEPNKISQLKQLAARGWVRKEGSCYSLHPVIADILADDLKPNTKDCWLYLESVTDYLGFPCVTLQQRQEHFQLGAATARRIEGDDMAYANFCLNYADTLRQELNFQKAVAYNQKAAAIFLQIFGEEEPYLATAYNNIGLVYSDYGKYTDALEYYQKSLRIAKRVLGEGSLQVATSYENLGMVYHYLCQYDTALEYYNKALRIRQETTREELHFISTYSNIGSICFEKGDYPAALKYYKKVLASSEKYCTGQHLAPVYNNMGAIYTTLGQYDTALEYYTKALRINQEALGEHHPETAACYNNIGGIYSRQQKFDEALEYYQKGLAINREIFGGQHPNIIISYLNIGMVYHRKGEYSTALKYYWKALEIDQNAAEGSHKNTATIYNNIGGAYYGMGDYQNAVHYIKMALEIEKGLVGENHPNVATYYSNIAQMYQDWKQYPEALRYYHKALEVSRNLFGEQDASVSMLYNAIAYLYQHQQNYPKALQYFQKSLKLEQRRSGGETKAVAVLSRNIGFLYSLQKNYPKALEAYQNSLRVNQMVFGEESMETAGEYISIGDLYETQRCYSKAITYYQKALRIHRHVLGEQHPEIALDYNEIGHACFMRGDFSTALDCLEKSFSIFKETLGEDHPHTVSCRNNLLFLRQKMGGSF